MPRPFVLRRPQAALAAALAFAAPAAAHAQSAPHPAMITERAGRVVRVFAPRVLEGTPNGSPWFIGPLVAADDFGVTVQTVRGTVTVPHAFVREFAARAGTGHRIRAAVLDALVGGAAGALVGKMSTPERLVIGPDGERTGDEGPRHLRNGALIGAASGLLFAALAPWHEWESGPAPTAVTHLASPD